MTRLCLREKLQYIKKELNLTWKFMSNYISLDKRMSSLHWLFNLLLRMKLQVQTISHLSQEESSIQLKWPLIIWRRDSRTKLSNRMLFLIAKLLILRNRILILRVRLRKKCLALRTWLSNSWPTSKEKLKNERIYHLKL